VVGCGCVRIAWVVMVDDGREKRERVERGVWSVDSIFIFTSKVSVNEC